MNFHKYIFEMKRFIISSYEPAIIAFQKGLLQVIESKFLKIFTDEELSMIVSGQQIFNWKEFKQSTKYESGYNENSESGIITFNIKDIFAQDLAIYLNKYNICVRAGNHCAKILKEEVGVSNSLRVSLYFYNTESDIDALVELLRNKEKIMEEMI